MAWLSRVNFVSSDTLSFTDINNLGNDIRAWGDNVNGGGYTLSNVAISASSGTMGLVIGGTGTTSTLRLRSTSGVGTTGADIIFQAGNNGATEVMRLQNGGNVGIGTSSPSVFARLHVSGGPLLVTSTNDVYINPNYNLVGPAIQVPAALPLMFVTNSLEKMRIDSSGNVGIGTTSPAQRLEVLGVTSLPATSGTTQNGLVRIASTATNAIDFGLSNASPFGAWIQTANVFGLGTTYPLLLNPNGGNVGIGTASPATSAKLEIAGTTGALLVPRLTTTERNALTAVNGMIIYNTTDNQMQGRINGAWVAM